MAPESTDTTLRLGAHVDAHDPIGQAAERGADLVQIFIGDPQGWKQPVLAHEPGPEALRQAAEQAGVAVYVHAPYVLNVASTNNRIRIPSRKLLQQQVDAAAEIGALGIVVHGGHVTGGDDPEVGFDNWRKCIDQLDMKVPVLIENTAGGDHAMARRLDSLGRLWEAIHDAEGGDTVGLCLDTCHAHAGGIELATAVERVTAITGRVDLLHCNDSRDDFDSGADRHANLGRGRIDPGELAAVVRAAAAPVVLETKGGLEGHLADIAWLRERV